MQNLSVIATVIVAAAAIIAVLLWRLKAPPAVDIEPLNKRIQEEIQKAEGIQAKLEACDVLLRTAEANCAAAKASETAANLRADTADLKTNQQKSEFDALQKQWNDAEPKIATAVEQKKAAEEARAIIAHRQEILELQNGKLQSDLTDAVGRASGAVADLVHKRTQIDDMRRTIETLELGLSEEKSKLNQALAKQQSDEDAANKLENLSHAVLEKTMTETEQRLEKIVKSLQKSSGDELEKHAEKVAQTLEPLQAKLVAYDKSIKSMEETSYKTFGGLTNQISDLQRAEQFLHNQAKALTSALTASPKIRGNYGELTLKRLVEAIGMQEKYHFEPQASCDTEAGRRIPDLVIFLPGEQKVIIDAKAVLNACVQAYETENEVDRKQLLKKHSENVRSRVSELSTKDYFSLHRESVESVVLFLPTDSLFYAALENDPGLIEFAASKKVIICSPGSLIMLLTVANHLWRQSSIEKDAQAIKKCGEEILNSACIFIETFTSLGKRIGGLQKEYNSAIGTLETGVIYTGKKMKAFKSISGQKEVSEPVLILGDVREFKAATLHLASAPPELPGLIIGERENLELTLASGEK